MTNFGEHQSATAASLGNAAAPDVTVVRGKPTAEQLAAVVAALRVVLARNTEVEAAPRSFWGMPQMRTTLPHGRGMWTHSLRNR